MEPHLQLYDETYFARGKQAGVSGYDDYQSCRDLLFAWSQILDDWFHPNSVLDVGAAYGFVPLWFERFSVPAIGIEPSAYARSQSVVPLIDGALPDLPLPAGYRADLVTCTEVLEHVPEELIPQSLAELARVTKGYLVLLIMLEGPAAHDDAGHICLHDREWWEHELDEVGLVRQEAIEDALNRHSLALQMNWAGRIFVRGRA